MMRRSIITMALLAGIAPAPAQADELSRFAQACEYAARQALVSTFTFERTGVADTTSANGLDVTISYNAVSTDSGKTYEETFLCAFKSIADSNNIVLDTAETGGRVFGFESVNALNSMLKRGGFQRP